MKVYKILFVLTIIISATNFSFAGGGGCTGPTIPCSDALPFCSDNSYNFQNSPLQNGETCPPDGPNYGCLGSQPNPIWYYMQIGQSGTMQLNLAQTTGSNGTGNGLDVDFAMWGPFTTLSAGCNSVMNGTNPIQCSFSTAATETLGIGMSGGTGSGASTPTAAVAGQFYIVMITNYSGSNGYITFNQTGGTGSADCSIVDPDCVISSVTANPTACNASIQYDLSGQITFNEPPTTGTLTVTSTCGQSQTFNAPFTSPKPIVLRHCQQMEQVVPLQLLFQMIQLVQPILRTQLQLKRHQLLLKLMTFV
jgi:hypothetical protein